MSLGLGVRQPEANGERQCICGTLATAFRGVAGLAWVRGSWNGRS